MTTLLTKKIDLANNEAKKEKNITFCSYIVYSILVNMLGKKVQFVTVEAKNKVALIGIKHKDHVILPDRRIL